MEGLTSTNLYMPERRSRFQYLGELSLPDTAGLSNRFTDRWVVRLLVDLPLLELDEIIDTETETRYGGVGGGGSISSQHIRTAKVDINIPFAPPR